MTHAISALFYIKINHLSDVCSGHWTVMCIDFYSIHRFIALNMNKLKEIFCVLDKMKWWKIFKMKRSSNFTFNSGDHSSYFVFSNRVLAIWSKLNFNSAPWQLFWVFKRYSKLKLPTQRLRVSFAFFFLFLKKTWNRIFSCISTEWYHLRQYWMP